MARSRLSAAAAALTALVTAACDRVPDWALLRDAPNAVTVKLPPPRPPTPAPGFKPVPGNRDGL